MFEIGDYIVYGNNGVCKVDGIGKVNLSGLQKDRLYYTLIPIYSKGSKVFTPTNSDKVVMRHVISKEDALKLIDNINDIETLWVEDGKKREEAYKQSMRKCDCKECIRIVKTLYLRKRTLLAAGKKVTVSDEKYLHMAGESLFGELAIPLGMEKEKIENVIMEKVQFLANA
ncbi:CarD family transcriptional regulator [Lachnospiraceae bacterium ZAX-1]